MEPRVGSLIKVTGSIQHLFGDPLIGVVEEIYVGASFDKEYKIRWSDPRHVIDADGKIIAASWLKLEDFEIISEN